MSGSSLKASRNADSKKEADPPPELESQFVLRLPAEPAKLLREMIQSGANNLKDRLSIRIENDMRNGEVRLDHLLLHAKVMDLPTIIESLKTIDNKTFYKTSDICQIVICKEDDDQPTTDEETPSKNKKKDPNKVDKKYLYPHGITPPLKNVRKKRFRKTLKKKYVEAPEIEKEVKRLLRVDNEAVNVKWEVINEEEEKVKGASSKEEADNRTAVKMKMEKAEVPSNSVGRGIDVAEQDIFGGEVSDSDEEVNINIMEIEDTSRLSADSSRMSDSTSRGPPPLSSNQNTPVSSRKYVTQFSKEMFSPTRAPKEEGDHYSFGHSRMFDDIKAESFDVVKSEVEYNEGSGDITREELKERMSALEKELDDLKNRRQQQEQEVANIENMALRQRFQDILDNLLTEQMQKEQEYNEVRRSWERLLRN